MTTYYNGNQVKKVYYGTQLVKKVYYGTQLVYSAIFTGRLENYLLSQSYEERGDEVKEFTKVFGDKYKFRKFVWGKQWKAVDGGINPRTMHVEIYGSTNSGSSWTLLNSSTIDQNYTGNTDQTQTLTSGNTSTYYNAVKVRFWATNATSNAIRVKNLHFEITEWEL